MLVFHASFVRGSETDLITALFEIGNSYNGRSYSEVLLWGFKTEAT